MTEVLHTALPKLLAKRFGVEGVTLGSDGRLALATPSRLNESPG